MMQVIPKWRVTIARPNAPSLVLFISDQFLSNVLRKLADIELAQQPSEISIALVDQVGPIVMPNYGCTCHSSAGCPLHPWTIPGLQT